MKGRRKERKEKKERTQETRKESWYWGIGEEASGSRKDSNICIYGKFSINKNIRKQK